MHSWSLKRWLLSCMGLLGAVLLVLFSLLAANYRMAADSRVSVALIGKAHIELQVSMRAVTEYLMSEGSTFAALKLTKDSAQNVENLLAELSAHHGTDETGQALSSKLQPAWQKMSESSKVLLAIRGMSPTDAASIAAYARTVGYFDDVVRETLAIEAAETAAAAKAEKRLLLLGAGGASGALLALLLIGLQIYRVVFARLGGEPALACELAGRLADYDLTVQFPQPRAGQEGTVMQALRRICDNLTTVVTQVRSNAEVVADASAQIAKGNEELSGRTEDQASSLQETTASTERLSGAVAMNANSAKQANALAQSASSVAVQGGEVVGEVVQTMKGINDSSRQISNIIGVIDGIAFQTNILALNAAVEAARAGEQGRGFAVVASEVRGLAQRSAGAAREIKELISASVQRVEAGTVLVDRAGSAMQETVRSIRQVTDIMSEISAASAEQSAGVAQLSQAMERIDKTTQQNSALVEQSSAAAQSLKQQADNLVDAVSVFKLETMSA